MIKKRFYYRTRDQAVNHLLEIRQPDGSWNQHFNLNAFFGAIYIITLRTTGIIKTEWALKEEAKILYHINKQVNPDGGFYKYPGSPSCKMITRIALLAIHLSLGKSKSKIWPAEFFHANPSHSPELKSLLLATVQKAELFLRNPKPKTPLIFEIDHIHFWWLFSSYINRRKILAFYPVLGPVIGAFSLKNRLLKKIRKQLNTLTSKTFPAMSIICRRIHERNRGTQILFSIFKLIPGFKHLQETAIAKLADHIRKEQNQSGAWFYNSFYTMLNIIALKEAGVPTKDPSIQNAIKYLRTNTCADEDNGSFINFMSSDIWDTGMACHAYLTVPGKESDDPDISPALKFLLRWQNSDGSFSFASASQNEPDNDSTALVLHVIAIAIKTAQGELLNRLTLAQKKGVAFLLLNQNKQGGWSVWNNSIFKARAGAQKFFKQILLDKAFADVTSRILTALGKMGYGMSNRSVRQAVSYLLNLQCKNGSWWSRWWAGYIPGTNFSLIALSGLGFEYNKNTYIDDKLMGQAHRALCRGIDFIISKQNVDGGWGDSILSDRDFKKAGKASSSPLHTAHTLTALLFCKYPIHSSIISKGYKFLISKMNGPGLWYDGQSTFSIFSGTYYYQYPLMAQILPLEALTIFLKAQEAEAQNNTLNHLS